MGTGDNGMSLLFYCAVKAPDFSLVMDRQPEGRKHNLNPKKSPTPDIWASFSLHPIPEIIYICIPRNPELKIQWVKGHPFNFFYFYIIIL